MDTCRLCEWPLRKKGPSKDELLCQSCWREHGKTTNRSSLNCSKCDSPCRDRGTAREIGLCHACYLLQDRPSDSAKDHRPQSNCCKCHAPCRIDGMAKDMGMCHACWILDGRPYDSAEECSKCRGWLRRKGPARTEGLCQNCFEESVPDESESLPKTWREVCQEVLDPDTNYSRSTLFLGNLHWSIFTSERDVVNNIVRDGDSLRHMPRLKRGKGQVKRVNGVLWKVHKTFAFAEFKNADDAKAVMERIHGFLFDGRAVVAYPAVFHPDWPDA